MDENFISPEEAWKLTGYLQKKSASYFGGWQKRYFTIQDGRYVIYAEKKGGKAKGVIDLEKAIISLDNLDNKVFKISISEKDFILKAESEVEAKSWFEGLKSLTSNKFENPIIDPAEFNNQIEDVSIRPKSNSKKWKINNIDKDAFDAFQKSKQFGDNSDQDLSTKMISAKGIKRHLENIPSEIIDSRMICGFLHKRPKSSVENYQKRWVFLISSRPLNEKEYDTDDFSLEEKILPSFLMFDNIYYYKVENEKDSSEAVGKINLMECHEVDLRDKDSKFFFILDMGEKKLEFSTEFMGERDKWLEAINYSRKTAKDNKRSLSRIPRNLNKLVKLLESKGISRISSESEQEKNRISQVYLEIGSFEILEMLIINLKKHLFKTVDGCIIYSPPNIEILKIYVDIFNMEILLKVQEFWKRSHEHISNVEIINLGCILYEFQEQLYHYGIDDPNFPLNARQFFKIYSKKTFFVMKELLENIMKSEREIKAVRGADEILITHSPTQLFKIMYETLEIIKNKKVKPLFESFLFILKESIKTYLVGVDYLLNRNDLDIDKEFLIAISNNSIRINIQLSEMIQDIKSLGVIHEKEIEEHLKIRETVHSLNKLSNLAINRLVNELSAAIIKDFNTEFLELETDKIIHKTIEVYGRFVNYMHLTSQKKLWNEVLMFTLYYYVKSLLTTTGKKIKKLEEITDKMKYDKENIGYIFERFLGPNSTKEQLKILEDFLDFLESPPEMISICFSKLKQFHGNAFSFSTAKALINLRIDFTLTDKKETLITCKQILNKMEINSSSDTNEKSLFDLIEEHIHEFEKNEDEQQEEEKEKERKLNQKDEMEEENNHKSKSLNEISKGQESIKEKVAVQTKVTKENDKEFFFIKLEDKVKKDSDIIISGLMQKKSYSTWQERFFTLKNGFLYWYKNEEAREAQNFISLADCKRVNSHKPKKFKIFIPDKIYKFSCKNDEERDKWVKSINNEIIRLRGELERKVENYYQIKLRKKMIVDYSNLPTPKSDVNEIRRKIQESLLKEKFFVKKEATHNKEDLIPNRKIVDKRAPFKEEIPRIKPVEIQPMSIEMKDQDRTISENSETSLDKKELKEGFIEENNKKNKSVFDCCVRFIKLLRPKKKRYNEFEG